MVSRSLSQTGKYRSVRNRNVVGNPLYTLPFHRSHYQLFGLVIGVILLGFIALASESITVGPLLMVAGYCLGIPLVLVWKGKSPGANSATNRKHQKN